MALRHRAETYHVEGTANSLGLFWGITANRNLPRPIILAGVTFLSFGVERHSWILAVISAAWFLVGRKMLRNAFRIRKSRVVGE
jgi:hypothetical protein